MLWLIPTLPLVGFAVNGLLSLGSARSERGAAKGFVAALAVAMPAAAFLITLLGIATLVQFPGQALVQSLWHWLPIGAEGLAFGLLFDRLTALMLLFITGIGTLIHVYSIGYMWQDRGFARFMAYLNLFMASMIILVLGDSLVATFLGWEGVGLCSYLLIGFWHKTTAYNDAARKAFVINRIGDLGFLLGAFCLFAAMGDAGSLRYADISAWFTAAPKEVVGSGLVVAAAALLFLGCTGKSAQVPLLTWLPDAMAGPTPVSALIHAATMVTSGVYLVARLADVFVLAPQVMTAITLIGLVTAVYGAIAGLVQQDIKKVLAYSTVSQLGFMFMAAGVGAFDVALFHVFTHAFFKATLFLGAGSVIHALHHEQDMRRMGGLAKALPITYSSMWFGWYAIIGMPLASGFMSKDLILERLFAAGDLGVLVGIAALLTALLTAIYMSRMMYLVFWSPSRIDPATRAHVHESPFTMTMPLFILGIGSLIVGTAWVGFSEVMDKQMHLDFFAQWLAPVLGHAQTVVAAGHAPHEGHGLVWMVMIFGTIAAVIGWLIAMLLFRRGPRGSSEPGPLTGFAAAWTDGFDRVYDLAVIRPTRGLSWILARIIDQALIGSITRTVADIAVFLGEGYSTLQRSRLRSSLAMSVVGVVVIIAVLLWPGAGR
ncbi:MAG: NADH-quinone oxidoreductase subunit L [Planctomycetes bacterium]|nr:NADH-quinone oxidoreductase subunit L [Planctomycetota bacterium]